MKSASGNEKTIRTANLIYYESTFNRCKHNIRKTWQTINEIISKSQKGTSHLIFGRPLGRVPTPSCSTCFLFNKI